MSKSKLYKGVLILTFSLLTTLSCFGGIIGGIIGKTGSATTEGTISYDFVFDNNEAKSYGPVNIKTVPGISSGGSSHIQFIKKVAVTFAGATMWSSSFPIFGIGGNVVDRNKKTIGFVLVWYNFGDNYVNQPNRTQYYLTEFNLNKVQKKSIMPIDVSWNSKGNSPLKITGVSKSDGGAGVTVGPGTTNAAFLGINFHLGIRNKTFTKPNTFKIKILKKNWSVECNASNDGWKTSVPATEVMQNIGDVNFNAPLGTITDITLLDGFQLGGKNVYWTDQNNITIKFIKLYGEDFMVPSIVCSNDGWNSWDPVTLFDPAFPQFWKIGDVRLVRLPLGYVLGGENTFWTKYHEVIIQPIKDFTLNELTTSNDMDMPIEPISSIIDLSGNPQLLEENLIYGKYYKIPLQLGYEMSGNNILWANDIEMKIIALKKFSTIGMTASTDNWKTRAGIVNVSPHVIGPQPVTPFINFPENFKKGEVVTVTVPSVYKLGGENDLWINASYLKNTDTDSTKQ